MMAALIALGGLAGDQQPAESVLRLQLRRSEVSQDEAEAMLRHSQALYEKGLLSLAELERAQANAERARLETELARAALQAALPDVRVVAAVKGFGQRGEPHVDLVLETLAPGRPGDVRRILLSLVHDSVIVGEPYQEIVTLPGQEGKRISLRFRLLSDVDRLSVVATSGNHREEIPVLLQRAEGSRRLAISCNNFSQEGALGEAVDFLLHLERSSLGASEIRLELDGLAPAFGHEWLDAEKKSRLGELRLAPGERTLTVNLRIFVPARAQPEWTDRAQNFSVVARSTEGAGAEEGRAALQLRPFGAPILNLTSDNLLVEVARDEARSLTVRVNNLGSVMARDVQLQIGAPLGMEVAVRPSRIALISPGEAGTAELRIVPRPDAVSGEYTLPVRAQTEAHSVRIESQELAFRVVLLKPGLVLLKTTLLAVLALLVLGTLAWVALRRHRHRARPESDGAPSRPRASDAPRGGARGHDS
jgi:hypothetical protein